MGIFRKENAKAAGGSSLMFAGQEASLITALAALKPQHVRTLQEKIYGLHRVNGLMGGFSSDPQMFIWEMQSVLPVTLPSAVAEAERRRATSAGTELPYLSLVATGANQLANPAGVETQIGRCVVSGIGEYQRHRSNPVVLAQWLTFYQLYALECGPDGSPKPDPFTTGLVDGLSKTIAAYGLGDVPVLSRRE